MMSGEIPLDKVALNQIYEEIQDKKRSYRQIVTGYHPDIDSSEIETFQ